MELTPHFFHDMWLKGLQLCRDFNPFLRGLIGPENMKLEGFIRNRSWALPCIPDKKLLSAWMDIQDFDINPDLARDVISWKGNKGVVYAVSEGYQVFNPIWEVID